MRIEPDAIYDDDSLYTCLRLSPQTLANARRNKTLRFTRKGKRILYLGRWVLDWFEAGDTPPGSSVPHDEGVPA